MINMKNATKWRYFSSAISVILMIVSINVIAVKGLNWGLDFTGGVVSEIRIDSSISAKSLQPVLQQAYGQEVSLMLPVSRDAGCCVMQRQVPDKPCLNCRRYWRDEHSY